MRSLGFLEWLEHRSLLFPEAGEKSVEEVSPLCVIIFKEFIERMQKRHVPGQDGLVEHADAQKGTLLAMALEVM
jgi:hypothetical protein